MTTVAAPEQVDNAGTVYNFTLKDRCDRCGAAAHVMAILDSGGELMFCGHHSRQVENTLRPKTVKWFESEAMKNGFRDN